MNLYDDVNINIEETGDRIEPLLKFEFDELIEKLTPVDSINLNLSISYTLASLLFSFLTATGQGTIDHPIKGDLEKIKNRIDRFKKIKLEKDKIKNPEKRELTIDQAAAVRIISKELASNNNPSKGYKNEKKRMKFDK